jgi:hypothetical protein
MSIAIPIRVRFVPQANRDATCLIFNIDGTTIPHDRTIGNTTPRTAKFLPVSLPPLLSTRMKLIMPKTIAGMAVRPQVKRLRMPSTNAAVANRLVLGTTSPEDMPAFGNAVPQDRQAGASSGFSVPHFGQFIVFSLRFQWLKLRVTKVNSGAATL